MAPGPDKLYSTLRSLTSQSSICAFGCGLVVNSAPTRQSGLGPRIAFIGRIKNNKFQGYIFTRDIDEHMQCSTAKNGRQYNDLRWINVQHPCQPDSEKSSIAEFEQDLVCPHPFVCISKSRLYHVRVIDVRHCLRRKG